MVWRVQSNCSVMVIMAGDLVTEDMVFNVYRVFHNQGKNHYYFNEVI